MAVKTIELKEKGGRVQSFGVEHAVRLLKLKNSAWTIPGDSEFELVGNAIRKKPSPAEVGGKAKKTTNRKRGKTSKSA